MLVIQYFYSRLLRSSLLNGCDFAQIISHVDGVACLSGRGEASEAGWQRVELCRGWQDQFNRMLRRTLPITLEKTTLCLSQEEPLGQRALEPSVLPQFCGARIHGFLCPE